MGDERVRVSGPSGPPRSSWPPGGPWGGQERPSGGPAGGSLPGYPAGPPPGPPPGRPSGPLPGSGAPRRRRGSLGIGAVLLAALVGGLVASVVTAGAFLAVEDDAEPEQVAQPVGFGDDPLDIQELLTKAQPSVVSIHTDQTTSRGVFGGAGSGVIISDDGLVLTNSHVIGGATNVSITFYDGRAAEGVLVGSIPEEDIAVVQMTEPPDDVVPADLGDSADLRVGDHVVAIGNALNLGGPPSVTRGIVSAKDRTIQAQGDLELANLIQTDAAINPGNSGGALLNAAGEVVGINTAIISDAQNIGFAIAIDAVKPLIDEINAGEGDITPDGAFLGVSMVALDGLLEGVRDEYGVTVDEGVFVSELVPGSAAEAAGLQLGDVIVEAQGEQVVTAAEVSTLVRSLEPGDELSLVIERRGSRQEVTAVLQARSDVGGN